MKAKRLRRRIFICIVFFMTALFLSGLTAFPLALIAGHYRGIPFFHQLIDCSFGVIGLIPLLIVRRDIIYLEQIKDN